MIDAGLVADLEAAAYLAWPAREVVELDGWQLRFADGFSRRGNSVYPAQPSTLSHASKLESCRKWYADRSLPLIVRQTPASEAGLDPVLAAAGFDLEGLTAVMHADLSGLGTRAEFLPDEPAPGWWDAAARLWQIPHRQRPAWRGIIERISHPAAYVLGTGGDGPRAVGLGVVVGEWLGLFEITVRHDLRRQGIGSATTQSLLNWGKQAGATRAFLQVVEDNDAAVACYRKLGFEHAYTYWYRRLRS